jgi:hypothetical protein
MGVADDLDQSFINQICFFGMLTNNQLGFIAPTLQREWNA